MKIGPVSLSNKVEHYLTFLWLEKAIRGLFAVGARRAEQAWNIGADV